MKFLVKLVLPFVKNYILEEINKPENRTFVVAKLNEHIDIPHLNEEQEREVIEGIYNSLSKLTKAYLQVPE